MLATIKDMVRNDFQLGYDKLLYAIFFLYTLSLQMLNHTTVFQMISIVFMGAIFVYMIKAKKLYMSGYIVFFGFFVLYGYFQLYANMTVSREFTSNMSSTMLINLIINFFVLNYFFIDDNYKKFPKVFSQTSMIFCAYMLISNMGSLSYKRLGWNQPIPFGGGSLYQSNNVGFVFAMAFNMYLYRLVEEKKKRYLIWMGLLALCVALTGSRKALLIIMMGVVMILFLTAKGFAKKMRILLVGIVCAVLFFVAVMKIPVLYDIIGNRMESLISGAVSGEDKDQSYIVREHLTELAMEKYKESPVFGHGLDSFRTMEGSYGLYAHNNFAELLCCTGIVGFILFYLPYGVALLKLIYSLVVRNSKLIMLALSLLIIETAMEYGNVAYFERLYLTLVMFTYVVGTKPINNTQKKENNC